MRRLLILLVLGLISFGVANHFNPLVNDVRYVVFYIPVAMGGGLVVLFAFHAASSNRGRIEDGFGLRLKRGWHKGPIGQMKVGYISAIAKNDLRRHPDYPGQLLIAGEAIGGPVSQGRPIMVARVAPYRWSIMTDLRRDDLQVAKLPDGYQIVVRDDPISVTATLLY